MHVNIRGLSCNLLFALVGARKCLFSQRRAAPGAYSLALRGCAFAPSSRIVIRRASPAWPNHSLKLTPHGLQNWPRSAYAQAAPRGQFHKPRGSA